MGNPISQRKLHSHAFLVNRDRLCDFCSLFYHTICMGISVSQQKLHSHASVIDSSALIRSLVTEAHPISMGGPSSGSKCCHQAFLLKPLGKSQAVQALVLAS
jgi:hypothetical protein